MNQNQEQKGQWITFHIMPQSSSQHAETITGRLVDELDNGGYLIDKILATDDLFEPYIKDELNIINRTYVWRMQMLDGEPLLEAHRGGSVDGISGGLG